jgi:hypothetical protein
MIQKLNYSLDLTIFIIQNLPPKKIYLPNIIVEKSNMAMSIIYSLDDDGVTCSPRKNNNGSHIINRVEYPVEDPIWEIMKPEEYPKIIDDTTTFDKWKLTRLRYPNGGHFDWIVLHDRINDVHIQTNIAAELD